MGSKLGISDFPGQQSGGPIHIEQSSIASNGGSSVLMGGFVAPQNLQILSVNRTVIANEATHGTATTSASYRQHVLVNLGTNGAGTATLASLNQTASQAAGQTRAFALGATVTMAQGQVAQLTQNTVGAADNDGTVVQQGSYDIVYQLL